MNAEILSQLPQILFQIGKAIGSGESLSTTLVRISELVTELCGAAACSIMLADPDQRILLGKAAFGLARSDFTTVSFRYGEGIAGRVAESGTSICIADVDNDPRFARLGSSAHIRSLACVPLMHRDSAVGVLTVTTPEPNAFAPSSLDLLALVANTIALDIENIRLRRLAHTDALTGAYNRQYLDQCFPELVRASHQHDKPLCVAMFDVDHFKRVNDDYGHDVGDLVLAEIAHRLRDASRKGDVLVRYGGEEFLLLLPGATVAKAAEIADRMRVKLASAPLVLTPSDGGKQISIDIRISAGVAQLLARETGEQLFKRADQALYSAKAGGRNRVEVSDAV